MKHTPDTHLDESDTQWLRDLASLCRSHCDFLIAELEDSPALEHYAARVLVWRDAQFSTIPELIELCEAHSWNATIYEAWVWETENRLLAMKRTLGPTAARAFELVADCLGYGEPNTRIKDLALDYARACIEGTLTPELEEQFDSEFFDAAIPHRVGERS